MSPELVFIFCFVVVSFDVLSAETTKRKTENFTCADETDCQEFDTTTTATTSETEASQSAYDASSSEKYFKTTLTSTTTITVASNSVPRATARPKVAQRSRNEGGICGCDLTVHSCDVNCCCDVDCADLEVEKIFNCENDKYRLKLTGRRYCYDGNYIRQNKTRHLLEKLRDNLFCIAYDNLPPVQTADYDPIITDRITLDEILKNNKKSRFKLEKNANYIPAQFPTDKPYRYGDIIWKIKNGLIKELDLPQTGFSGVCSFKKRLKYLEDWKDSCLQITLKNDNEQLFAETYKNFDVIASPHLYNAANFTSENKICPRNVCVPLKIHYCFDSWSSCDKNASAVSPPVGKCNKNGSCTNIVKSIRYVISHGGGTKGIEGIKIWLKIGNATDQFYQYFEVEYNWLVDEDESRIIKLSGNPGYIFGKPLILGNMVRNKTGGSDRSYVVVDENDRFLTLPVAAVDGNCDSSRRYAVKFGEDLKLNCKIESTTRHFTSASCVDLQMLVVDALVRKILFNVTRIDDHSTYAAKLTNYIDNDNEKSENWAKILFDRIPTENILTGRTIDDKIICSGLVTSLRIDVVHRRLAEPQPLDNYKILGIAVTFGEESDIRWAKCGSDNCTDVLKVDVVSYAMFHDVSKPSKYIFAEGPNFDIALPHDFFYPFTNAARSNKSLLKLFAIIFFCTFIASDL